MSTHQCAGYLPTSPLWLSGPVTPEMWPYSTCWYQVEDWELRCFKLQAELGSVLILAEPGFPQCNLGESSSVVDPASAENVELIRQLWVSQDDAAAVESCEKQLENGAELSCRHSVQSRSGGLGVWRCSHTPLQIAACKGFKATVGKLLERGADVNETNEGGESALGFGVLIGDTEMVRLLLDKGADVAVPNLIGRTVVHHAATRPGVAGSTEVMEQLLKAGADAGSVDLLGWTPLHAAMTFCNPEISGPSKLRGQIAELLIGAKADVNKPTEIDSVTPLHVAAFYDTEWDILLLAGADIQMRDADQRRPMEIAHTMAPRMGYMEDKSIIPKWLSPHTDHRQLLTLLEKMETGFEIDPQGTVLIREQERKAEVRLQHSHSKPHLPGSNSGSAHLSGRSSASSSGSNPSRQSRCTKPFSPSSKNIYSHQTRLVEPSQLRGGRSKNGVATRNLYWASYHGSYPKMLDAILAGADVNSVQTDTVRNRSALHWAVTRNNLPGVKLLLDEMADPNAASTKWQRTPLMLAAQGNSRQICELLIKAGASLCSTTQAGHTAAQAAKLCGFDQLSEWLDQQK
eukprot:TRINITY_DN3240_c0_g1_i10.p1 TRINITY_DN3240_c0_g1~~TRINITY_DN3240_c0_g1_i10.p1  ORF type:complete len:573 (+),score=101.93 TRINITY_DN3240_c0_g1_i10:235-1953(+)